MTKKKRESLKDELQRLEDQLVMCEDSGLRKQIQARIAVLKEKLVQK